MKKVKKTLERLLKIEKSKKVQKIREYTAKPEELKVP